LKAQGTKPKKTILNVGYSSWVLWQRWLGICKGI